MQPAVTDSAATVASLTRQTTPTTTPTTRQDALPQVIQRHTQISPAAGCRYPLRLILVCEIVVARPRSVPSQPSSGFFPLGRGRLCHVHEDTSESQEMSVLVILCSSTAARLHVDQQYELSTKATVLSNHTDMRSSAQWTSRVCPPWTCRPAGQLKSIPPPPRYAHCVKLYRVVST